MSQSYLTAVNARSAWLNSSAPRPYPAYRSRPASNAPAPPCTRRCPTARNSPAANLRRCRGAVLRSAQNAGYAARGCFTAVAWLWVSGSRRAFGSFSSRSPSFPLAGGNSVGRGKSCTGGVDNSRLTAAVCFAAARRHGALPRDPAAFEKAGETFTCLRREQLRDFCS